MGNTKTALGAISSNPVKHGMAQIINTIRVFVVQDVSADGRKGHQTLIRNQQVTRSSRVAGSILLKNNRVHVRPGGWYAFAGSIRGAPRHVEEGRVAVTRNITRNAMR